MLCPVAPYFEIAFSSDYFFNPCTACNYFSCGYDEVCEQFYYSNEPHCGCQFAESDSCYFFYEFYLTLSDLGSYPNYRDGATDPCEFVGVECDGGRIISVSWASYGITGSLPLGMGYNLTELEGLYLQFNNFEGQLDLFLESFANTSLAQLDLTNNDRINGSIPTMINEIENLNYLSLSGNAITGTIPSELFGIPALNALILTFLDGLVGTLPSEMGSASLRTLVFDHLFNITGTLPDMNMIPLDHSVNMPLEPTLTVVDTGIQNMGSVICDPELGTIVIVANNPDLNLVFGHPSFTLTDCPVQIFDYLPLATGDLDIDGLILRTTNNTSIPYLVVTHSSLTTINPRIVDTPYRFGELLLLEGNEHVICPVPNYNFLAETADYDPGDCSGCGSNPCVHLGNKTCHSMYWNSGHFCSCNPSAGQQAVTDFLDSLTFLGGYPEPFAEVNPSAISPRFSLTLPACNYPGITCDSHCHIASIEIPDVGFVGTLPTAFGQLKNMTILNLSENSLGGEIPVEWGGMAALVNLDLSHNDLGGTIPPSVFDQMTQLDGVNVAYNHLEGKYPWNCGTRQYSSSPGCYYTDLSTGARSIASAHNISHNHFNNVIAQMDAFYCGRLLDASYNPVYGYLDGALMNRAPCLQVHIFFFANKTETINEHIDSQFATHGIECG